jgi:hypothetical protein
MFVACDSILLFRRTSISVSNLPRIGRTAMTQHVVERTDDNGSVSQHKAHSLESNLDRLRAENDQLRELVICLTSLLVRNVADRR